MFFLSLSPTKFLKEKLSLWTQVPSEQVLDPLKPYFNWSWIHSEKPPTFRRSDLHEINALMWLGEPSFHGGSVSGSWSTDSGPGGHGPSGQNLAPFPIRYSMRCVIVSGQRPYLDQETIWRWEDQSDAAGTYSIRKRLNWTWCALFVGRILSLAQITEGQLLHNFEMVWKNNWTQIGMDQI